MRYMLDTNICIYLMKAHPPSVLARLQTLDYGDAVMSVVTLTGLAETFAMFSPDFMAEGREFHEQKERQWDDVVQGSSVHQDPAVYAVKPADGT